MQAAKDYDRLRRMEAHVGALVDEIEDEPSDPSEDVAKKPATFSAICDCAGAAAEGGAAGVAPGATVWAEPHEPQKAALSAIAAPHFVQCAMVPPRIPPLRRSLSEANYAGKANQGVAPLKARAGGARVKLQKIYICGVVVRGRARRGRWYTGAPCGSGGIGRRASLRSWWPKGRRGSSPFFRTTS